MEPSPTFIAGSIFNDPMLLPLSSNPSIFNLPPLQLPRDLHSLYYNITSLPDMDTLPHTNDFLDLFSNLLPDLHSFGKASMKKESMARRTCLYGGMNLMFGRLQ
ncbi:hypothetical protein COLO4_25014 [Corchorus olitorius]|uniref:Uncharacterized protein n=1 Tax=Corchorus olitorius TaxID=93759 RepID=A0A1R3I5B0_9ROSI|nr:hypothetical protein COLO4_25014 [Corchorus olitorius]